MSEFSSSPRRTLPHITALVIYLLIIVLTLDQLFLHFGAALPGDGKHYDYAIFYWDMWWMRHALIDLHTAPFTTNFILYPFTHNLVMHTLVPFWGLFALPLQSILTLNQIFNIAVTLSFLLTAFLTYVFAYHHSRSWALSLLAGALMAFTPPMMHRTEMGHLNMLPMWWIPLALLTFDWIYQTRHAGSAVSLAFCLYAALLTDLQYMMWVPLILGPYALVRILSKKVRSDQKRLYNLLARLGLALVVLAGLTLLYPVPQLQSLSVSRHPEASAGTADYYSLSLSTFVKRESADRTMGLLITPLTLIVWVLGGRGKKQGALWLAIAAFSLVLALGPYIPLKIQSRDLRLPLPYLLLHRVLDGQYRCPARFAVPAVFSMSVFIALRGRTVLQRLGANSLHYCSALLAVILVTVIVDYGLLDTFPIFFPPEYAAYQDVSEDTRDVTLLEVPLGVDTGYTLFGHGQQLIYYQPLHEKRIPSGALSRMALTPVHYFQSYNLLASIAGEAELEPSVAREELEELTEEWNISYVFVHRALLDKEEQQQIIPFLATQQSVCFWQAEKDILAYRIPTSGECPTSNKRTRITFDAPGDPAHVGPGWHRSEDIGNVQGRWAGRSSTATLRFDLKPQSYRLRFRALAYPPDQVVYLKVNDKHIATLSMQKRWTTYTATIPSTAIKEGEPTLIDFVHEDTLSPKEKTEGENPDERSLGAAYDWIALDPLTGE